MLHLLDLVVLVLYQSMSANDSSSALLLFRMLLRSLVDILLIDLAGRNRWWTQMVVRRTGSSRESIPCTHSKWQVETVPEAFKRS